MKPLLLIFVLIGFISTGVLKSNSFELPQESRRSKEESGPFIFGRIPEKTLQVSMLELIAVPKKYKGKLVKFKAILTLNPGILYLDAVGLNDSSNTIWVELPDEIEKQIGRFSGSLVEVAGKFNYSFQRTGGAIYRELKVQYLKVEQKGRPLVKHVVGTNPENAIDVSMLELIVNPLKYKRKYIKFEANIELGLEETGTLFLVTLGLTDSANTINLVVPDGMREKIGSLAGDSGLVAGRFDCLVGKNGEILYRELSVEYLEVDTFE